MSLKKLFAILFASIIGAGLFVTLWLWSYAVSPAGRQAADSKDYIVAIPAGSGLHSIRAHLAEAGVIEDDIRFVLLARLLDVSRRLQAGEYRFPAGATPVDILRQLEAGRIVAWPVTVPEGATLVEIAEILAREQWVERERFLGLVRDPQFIRELGIEADSLEGYLFPETYYLNRGQGAEEIIRMMVGHLQGVMAELCPDAAAEFPPSAPLACTGESSPPFTFHELLTLASIVEKETGRAGERPLIACVFLNRLQKGMRLQADPTVIYGIAEFDGNLTRRHLRMDSPYNTYKVKGLPPTPIANPGRAAIEAVLRPAPESYLYFVSRNDGSHQFSATLREHNKAVARYQKGRK